MRRIKLARFLSFLSGLLPVRYPLHGELNDQPIFVFGSGRNGSTLLNRILNQHSKLQLPSEQNFLGSSIIKFKLYNFFNWRDLMKIIGGELFIDDGAHTWPQFDASVLKRLTYLEDRSLQRVLDLIFRSSFNQTEKKYWGDTTPQNTRYYKEISEVFPKGKYIFLIRNPLDVVASYHRGSTDAFGELVDVKLSVRLWKDSLKAYHYLSKNHQVKLLRYEDLVNDPTSTLSALMSYLNLDFEENMLFHDKFESVSMLHSEPQHNNIKKGIFNSSIEKWKSSLSEREVQEVLVLIGAEKTNFGY
jgi:hypothetical protein